jgi:hypothetical protein
MDIVKLLLNHGADPNIQGENVFCFEWTWHSKILQGGYFGTPLQGAAYRGHKDTVELLLNSGADPNIEGENVFVLNGHHIQRYFKVVSMEMPIRLLNLEDIRISWSCSRTTNQNYLLHSFCQNHNYNLSSSNYQ